jgi:sulfinoalanine decarboxylase
VETQSSAGGQLEQDSDEYPILVAATSGTTVLGAFDEIEPVSSVCKNQGVWLHVDGAWGGPALFSKKLRPLVRGIELADSVAFDAHKLFGANLTSSFFLTRHNKILHEANDVTGGDYLFHSDGLNLDLGKLSWQCGRKADAMSFWTIWKSVGTDGLGDFVDRLLEIREETLNWIRTQSRLELVSVPDYLNICVRVIPPHGKEDPDWAKFVRERLKEKDQAMVNYSENQEGSFLRLILAHPYLKFEHVRQVLEWALEVQ